MELNDSDLEKQVLDGFFFAYYGWVLHDTFSYKSDHRLPTITFNSNKNIKKLSDFRYTRHVFFPSLSSGKISMPFTGFFCELKTFRNQSKLSKATRENN